MAAEYRPWPWRTKNQDSQRKSWLREEGKWGGEKKRHKWKRTAVFLSTRLPTLVPALPTSSLHLTGAVLPGTRENEGKKGGWRKKSLENCLSNITPVLRTGSVLSGEGKGHLRRRENKVGECIREAHARSLSLMRSQNDMSIHTHSGLHQHTHNNTIPEF